MNLVSVLETVYLRCDEDFTDRQDELDKLMKFGLNQAYKALRTKFDIRVKSVDLPYTDRIALPTDFYSIVEIKNGTDLLSDLDYDIVGNVLLMKNQKISSGTISLYYVYLPTNLSADTDVIDLKDIYIDYMTTFASYVYLLANGKGDLATIYLNEYKTLTQAQKQGGAN